jgi:hypothetical protein
MSAAINSALDRNPPSPNVSAVNLDENRFTPAAKLQKPDSITRGKSTTTWFALYGFLFIFIALFAYVTNVLLGPLRLLLLDPPLFLRINELVVWYSGIPLVIGTALVSWDLIRNVTRIRRSKFVRNDPPANRFLTVALTACNDERSIAGAVKDFRAHPLVRRVIVISNNSADRTMELAEQSGALVFNETRQGYGACVHRALREALKFEDTELTLLCEGDLTKRAQGEWMKFPRRQHGQTDDCRRFDDRSFRHRLPPPTRRARTMRRVHGFQLLNTGAEQAAHDLAKAIAAIGHRQQIKFIVRTNVSPSFRNRPGGISRSQRAFIFVRDDRNFHRHEMQVS